MKIKKLFEIQKELDSHIINEHKLEGKNLVPEKIVAFIVELGELANEIRFFKFWSNKPKSHPNIILEEYVDGVHFLLSLGLDIGANQIVEDDFKIDLITLDNLTDEFIYIISLAIELRKHSTYENYRNLLNRYLSLAYTLGFTEEQIIRAYLSKNLINHKRQEQGY